MLRSRLPSSRNNAHMSPVRFAFQVPAGSSLPPTPGTYALLIIENTRKSTAVCAGGVTRVASVSNNMPPTKKTVSAASVFKQDPTSFKTAIKLQNPRSSTAKQLAHAKPDSHSSLERQEKDSSGNGDELHPLSVAFNSESGSLQPHDSSKPQGGTLYRDF